MSDLFSYDQQGIDTQLAAAAEAPSIDSLEEIEAPAFRGIGKGIGNALMRGSAATGDFFATFGKSPAMSDEQERINAIADDIQEQQRKDAIDYWTPKPNEVGRVGQVVGGLAEILPPLVIGVGNPALLVGSTTLKAGKELIDEGVDATTAGEVAAVEGAANYLGFKVPIAGKTLAGRLATGAAGNVVVGAASRGASGEVLESQGYETQAERYSQDLATLSTDVLVGMLFGGTHHALAPGEAPKINPALSPTQVDAVLTARNAKSFAENTTPGTPDGLHAEVAHQEALETSLSQLSRGEEVNLGDVVARHEAGFTDATHVAESVKLAELVESVEPQDVPRAPEYVAKPAEEADTGYSVAEGELTDEQLAAFQGLRSDLQADQDVGGPGARDAGESRDQGDGGPRGEPLTVYRGASRELTAEDFRPEALGHATEHPSSGLGVFFTNSASHAANYGKVSEHLLDIRNPKIVPVEDFPGLDSLDEYRALAKQLQAEGHDGMVIDASHLGGPVNYVAFGHEQVLAAKKSAIAQDVRLEDPAKREALEQLRDKIGLSERGGMGITDGDPVKPVPLGRTIHVGDPLWLNRPGADTNQAISKASALSALDRVRDGKPLGAAQARFIKYALDELDSVTADSTDYVNEAAAPEMSPELQAAHEYLGEQPELDAVSQLIESQPDTPVLVGYDVEGNPIKTTLAEAHAESMAQLERDLADTKAYEAAITCFLGRGA